jgi:hypothetical protein
LVRRISSSWSRDQWNEKSSEHGFSWQLSNDYLGDHRDNTVAAAVLIAVIQCSEYRQIRDKDISRQPA